MITDKILSIDCETTGLEECDRPFMASIANDKTEFAFDERENLDCWAGLAHMAADPQVTWIMQNAKFDLRMLGSKGVHFEGQIIDIEVMARLVRNDYLSYSLDNQAWRAFKKRKDQAVEEYIKRHNLYEVRKDVFGEERKGPRYQDVPMQIMHTYAKKDARLTYDLFKHYSLQLSGKTERVLYNESALTPVCFKMERRGLKLNVDYTWKAYHHEMELLETYKEAFKCLTGKDYVGSAKSLQKVLKFRLPTTDKGNPSLTEDVIDHIMAHAEGSDIPIAELVRDIRTYDKRISTYYKPYLSLANETGGMIHADMRQAGTRTGRFSYRDPNLQNIPKEEGSTAEFVVRGCFGPRPGRKFFSIDYKQMEYFIAIAYAEETRVIEELNAGADFHQATADLLGIKRSQAKTLNFACLYGAGPSKLSVMLGISTLESRCLLDKYFTGLPRLEKVIQSIIRTGEARGYVTNFFGRDLYADRKFCYALPNHLIQSSGADVVKLAMVQIDAEFPDLHMVLQVHDQLVLELLPEEEKHLPRIIEIMESAWPEKNGVTLKVDITWSDKSLAERDMVKWYATEDPKHTREIPEIFGKDTNVLAVEGIP